MCLSKNNSILFVPTRDYRNRAYINRLCEQMGISDNKVIELHLRNGDTLFIIKANIRQQLEEDISENVYNIVEFDRKCLS